MNVADFMSLTRGGIGDAIPSVVSIGVFDGVHLGHQAILTANVSYARLHGWRSVAVTFNRNPKRPNLKPILSRKMKMEALAALGLDSTAIIDFSHEFSTLTANEFLNLLEAVCPVKAIVVGSDFRCGTPASCAGPDQLQEYLDRHGDGGKVIVPSYVRMHDGTRVSSTLIRNTLSAGNLAKVREMLGRPYGLDLSDCKPELSDDGLRYPLDAIGQMLPPEGTYAGLGRMSDGSAETVKVRLTDRFLLLPRQASGVDTDIQTLFLHERYGTW